MFALPEAKNGNSKKPYRRDGFRPNLAEHARRKRLAQMPPNCGGVSPDFLKSWRTLFAEVKAAPPLPLP
jgi:hypothetical protein